MIVSIHQSQYLPWPAYFKKLAISDLFVILDSVQFQKNGIQNRNKLRNQEGDYWLTVPVIGSMKDLIKEKKIANDLWKKKHLKTIQMSYSKAPFWKEYESDIVNFFKSDTVYLDIYNKKFISFIVNLLGINTKIVFSSSLKSKGSSSDLILSICKEVKAKKYICGYGAENYLDFKEFASENVEIGLLQSTNPIYKQFHGDFIPDLSILDMLMNVDRDNIKEYLLEEVTIESRT
jgi:hypothetical protein